MDSLYVPRPSYSVFETKLFDEILGIPILHSPISPAQGFQEILQTSHVNLSVKPAPHPDFHVSHLSHFAGDSYPGSNEPERSVCDKLRVFVLLLLRCEQDAWDRGV